MFTWEQKERDADQQHAAQDVVNNANVFRMDRKRPGVAWWLTEARRILIPSPRRLLNVALAQPKSYHCVFVVTQNAA